MPRATAKLLDARRKLGIACPRKRVPIVHIAEHELFEFGQANRTCLRAQVGYRVVSRRDPHALIVRRQEAGIPHLARRRTADVRLTPCTRGGCRCAFPKRS